MYKLIFIMAFTGLALTGNSQNFFREEINPQYKYVVLANPTVNNIGIIKFLVEKQIFKVDLKKIKFVGVYHTKQAYDFTQSKAYIADNKLDGSFFLHEISAPLPDDDVYTENQCSADFWAIFEKSIGAVFFGGPDIQPELYEEENSYSVVTDPVRHAFEVSLIFHLLGSSRNPDFKPYMDKKPNYLVTGFCLGMQTMNVATGGNLFQDIPAQVYGKTSPQATVEIDRNNLHRNYWQEFNNDKQLMGINLHSIRFTNHPFFGKTVKTSKKSIPYIYSSHHQSPNKIGTGFEITALSPDGKIIEGLAHQKFPNVFGVQFHPEVPALYENRELWKFSPDDVPRTFHQLIGKNSVQFHKKYWRHISAVINNNNK